STSSSTRIWPATARTTPRQTLPYSDVLPSMSPEPIPIRPLPCASSSSAPDGTTPFSSSYLATCDSPAWRGRVGSHASPHPAAHFMSVDPPLQGRVNPASTIFPYNCVLYRS